MPKIISWRDDVAKFDIYAGQSQAEERSLNVGDIVLLYELGEELFDPDTKQSLGCFEKVQWKTKVTEVTSSVLTVQCIEKYGNLSFETRYKLANREIMNDTSNEVVGTREEIQVARETTTEHIKIPHVAGALLMLYSVFKIVDISEQLIKSTMVWDMGALYLLVFLVFMLILGFGMIHSKDSTVNVTLNKP
jgi:hypothetical protein